MKPIIGSMSISADRKHNCKSGYICKKYPQVYKYFSIFLLGEYFAELGEISDGKLLLKATSCMQKGRPRITCLPVNSLRQSVLVHN